jgi:hypothetical protein
MGKGCGAHLLGTVTGDDNAVLWLQGRAGFQRVNKHGFTRDRVKDLRQVRIHPGAFASGKDNEGGFHMLLDYALLRLSLRGWHKGARLVGIKQGCVLQHRRAVFRAWRHLGEDSCIRFGRHIG